MPLVYPEPAPIHDTAAAPSAQLAGFEAQSNSFPCGSDQTEQFPPYVEPMHLMQNGAPGQNGCLPDAPMLGRIPQSVSYHAGQQLMSPEPTPGRHGDVRTNGCMASPENSQCGRLTEPRNYAPRTAGLPLINSPPPKFNLGLPLQASQQSSQGLFSPPHGSNNALVLRSSPERPTDAAGGAVVAAHSHNIRSQRSNKLNTLTSTGLGLPSYQDAMDADNFPFIESGRQARGVNHGVLKLQNIPFSTSRSEVIAFLGRNCKILNDSEEPVHIIMERVTSKTMDAYVEFQTLEDAMKIAEKHQMNIMNGRPNRLGDRPVDVNLSSQAALMKDLFPLAKGLVWNGAVPEFLPFNPNEPWENFKGFISEEEMTMLVKHVEVPHRSPFSRECPQRPYECLISTLKKFPWYLTDRITIGQRQAVFKATCELLRLLYRSIHRRDDELNLTWQLFRRVIAAAMGCPGFTPLMKDDIAYLVNVEDAVQLDKYNQPRFAYSWRHQLSLAPKPGLPLDVVEWYIAIIREQTQRDILNHPVQKRIEIQDKSSDTDMYWGYFWAEVAYPMGPHFDSMTLAQAGHAELSAIERILARALGWSN